MWCRNALAGSRPRLRQRRRKRHGIYAQTAPHGGLLLARRWFFAKRISVSRCCKRCACFRSKPSIKQCPFIHHWPKHGAILPICLGWPCKMRQITPPSASALIAAYAGFMTVITIPRFPPLNSVAAGICPRRQPLAMARSAFRGFPFLIWDTRNKPNVNKYRLFEWFRTLAHPRTRSRCRSDPAPDR